MLHIKSLLISFSHCSHKITCDKIKIKTFSYYIDNRTYVTKILFPVDNSMFAKEGNMQFGSAHNRD